MGYAVVAFIVCFLAATTALMMIFQGEVPGRRLAAVLGMHPQPAIGISWLRRLEQYFRPVSGSFQKLIPHSERDASVLRARLVRAGFRGENALGVLYACKVVVPMLLCALAISTGIYRWNWFIAFAGAIGVGYLIPDFTLDHLIKAREEEIGRGLPDLLDLLVVCLEAGLSLDQAVIRAVDEMRGSYLTIADEFGLVMLEVRAGRPRADAWRSLAERNDLEAVRTLVAILVQSDQFGTGISRTLRTHSDTMRTRRRQVVQEIAAKTPVKLLFPLIFFIFPLLMVIILGPAFLIISESLPF